MGMSGFSIVLLVIQIIAAIAIICLVLLQHGKGADMGAAFGSGSAGSLFGSSGSANFLSRMTSTAVTIFFVATLALTYIGFKTTGGSGSVFDNPQTPPAAVPAAVTTTPADEAPAATTTQPNPESTPTQGVNQIPAN
ncbi:Protein-export membrane protein SecG [Saezia sanguinis]|uniref:Protein-export membrane protein SecG n=2 Tax=Saezia sanguinis TaxID=1965230 RepID=A0A433SH19_9BURK|nr:Protein-export membrane protein SecG [Saezia sanguinis]